MTSLAQSGVNFGIKFTLLILSMTGALFVTEWSIRLALPAYDPAGHVIWRYHSDAGTILGQPGTAARQIKNSGDYNVAIRFNRHGFRDRQDVSRGEETDIYVVGDSFAFGWGVEEGERFSNVLAELSGERVFNLAASLNVDGYENLFPYAEKLGAKFGRVVLSLNMIDDVKSYPPKGAAATSPPQPATASTYFSLNTLKNFLLRESAFYFLMTQSINQIQPLRRTLIRAGIIKTIKEIKSDLPNQKAIDSTAKRLAGLDRRYDLTVLLIPSRGLWVGAKQTETRGAHEGMVRALQNRGIRFIDPLPELEKGKNPLQYHFHNDGHWNSRGHWLIGAILKDKLSGTR